jgi:hypothetical protein
MDTTLILSHVPSDQYQDIFQISELVQNVLGPSVIKNFSSFDDNITEFSTVVLMISTEHCADVNQLQDFFYSHEAVLKDKTIGLLCISNLADDDFPAFHNIDRILPLHMQKCLLCIESISLCKPLKKEIIADKLVRFRRCLMNSYDMPARILKEHIHAILQSHNTCSLCTSSGSQIRATPIEYIYENDSVYFLSEGGEKFAHLFANPHVGIAIYHEYTGFNALEGLQIEGLAQMVPLFSDEYLAIAQRRGLSPENVKKMPIQLHMIKVLPNRIQVLNSAFKKEGYAAKQVYIPSTYTS